MSRIFKIGSTKIVEDESMAGLSIEQVRDRLKSRFPEVAKATVRQREVDGVTYIEFSARVGRKG
jgi:hypothetical protein